MKSYKEIFEAYEQGRYHIAYLRKVAPVLTATKWTDMGYSAGTPIANYYASTPLVFAQLNGNEGIFKGVGNDRFLHKMCITNTVSSPTTYALMDYVLYAPFIDFDSTDEQFFTPMALPRYESGNGLQVMLICQGTGTGIGNITMNYTNQDGFSGRVSVSSINSTTTAGQAMENNNKLFLNLQEGDYGVRSIESVTMASAIGGIGAIVIVKQIAEVQQYEIQSPIEKDYFVDNAVMPIVHKNAYLHFMARCQNSTTPNLQAKFDFIW